MAVPPGARIGPYEVVSLIGSGGMGEVYLARDTQLGRNVALKVLPDMFASDAERLARFRREAQVLAALHHPNIAVIHGLEDSPSDAGAHIRALVLEYIEGDTLAERIAAGRIPLDEALGIARQIAEALQAAHDQGVIHRDLKPSNIKLTPDGAVKVLDFGLAKLASTAEAVSGASSSVSLSPTITSPAATMMGVILGTAAYMAPEQAKGKPADKRCDVWAFGCVLFEVLTGKRAFEGDDVSDTLASVLKGDPEWTALPPGVPPSIGTLLRGCLTKDPRVRLGDVAGALFILRHHDNLAGPSPTVAVATPRRHVRWVGLAAVVAGLAGALAGGTWLGWRLRPDDQLRSLITTFGVSLPQGETFTNPGRTLLAVSPDSRSIVYVAGNRLNLRSTDRLEATPLRGTEGQATAATRGPFFSPDSQWVGFWTTNQLKRISVNGGAVQVLATVAAAEQPGGAHWTDEKTILYAGRLGIWRVSEEGGVPELLVKAGDRRFLHPQLLPGGRAMLFTSLPADRSEWSEADIIVRTFDGAERRVATGNDARYVASGHLVFVVRGTLTAMAFDAATLTPSGGPIPLLEGIQEAPNRSGFAHFDVSATGTFVRVVSTVQTLDRIPTWIDRQGRQTPLGVDARPYLYLKLSPDDTRVALDVGRSLGNRDIWVWDVTPRAMRPLAVAAEQERAPIFTRDGSRIIFTIDRNGVPALYWQSVDGVGAPEQLSPAETGAAHFATTTAPDGTILLRRGTGDAGVDVYALSPGRERKLSGVITEPFAEQNAEVSHNGRWMAYQTTKSGRAEIVVRPYPALDIERPVSTAGGTEPLWSSDDRELFFRSPTGAIMRVVVTPGDTWNASTPEQVLPGEGFRLGAEANPFRTYDVSRDGRRFLMLKDPADEGSTTAAGPNIVVVENWFEELKRRVPVK